MPVLHQYDYIFAIGLIFSGLDAYNIGANDVANSFATSVSSRSLTMRQAVILAGLCEFLGAVLVGARVTGTIKNGIISLAIFEDNPGVQMMAFACAIVTSSCWLMFATKNCWPVSTTYSLVSALAGVGVATKGPNAVQWGWNNGKGMATIFAGFGIAPAIAAGFGAVTYLITKYTVLKRKNSFRAGLIFSPIFFFGVSAILTMSIVYKGAPSLNLDKLSQVTIALAIVLTGLVVAIISLLFWLPYVYCKVVRKDYTLRVYHIFLGPALWWRPAPPENPELYKSAVVDYRVRDRDEPVIALGSQPRDDDVEGRTEGNGAESVEGSDSVEGGKEGKDIYPQDDKAAPRPARNVPLAAVEQEPKSGWSKFADVLSGNTGKIEVPPKEGAFYLPKNLLILFRYQIPAALLNGSMYDVHAAQGGNSGDEVDRIMAMHEHSTQFDNDTEHLFSFLQVMTACTNSFAHGSNDVSNAVGPLAVIYYCWSEGIVTPKDTPTPVWVLVFGGALIVIGLATYGYNLMRTLGNRLTLMSPSRGFSMELGSAITVLLASQYAIPVSTTMCISGSTAGVGLISGGPKAVNWRAFGWIFLGWVLTVPVAGTIAGCLMGLFINAPHW